LTATLGGISTSNALVMWITTALIRSDSWSEGCSLHGVQDDQACLQGLDALWKKARSQIAADARIIRVGVFHSDLTQSNQRQLDFLLDDDKDRQRCEILTNTIDRPNHKFGKRAVTVGPWTLPPGEYAQSMYCGWSKESLQGGKNAITFCWNGDVR
jgi:hypothetical protein